MSLRKSSANGRRKSAPKKRSGITESGLQNIAGKFLASLGIKDAALDIFLLPNRSIAAMKRRLLGKRTEPNVLAFPEPSRFPHPEAGGRRYLGEIYMNADILKSSPGRTWGLLLHGLLHLLGYDHEEDADAAEMEKLEEIILSKKG